MNTGIGSSIPGPARLAAALIVSGLALCLASAPLGAQDEAETRARLAQVEADITALQAQLERDRGSLGREREALRRLDLDMQANARALRTVGEDRDRQRAAVAALETERNAYLGQLANRQDELGRQALAAWELSRESRLKLVLNQDDPAQLGRLLAYYDLLSEAQAERITELREVLARLATMQQAIDVELEALGDLQAEHERQRGRLQAQRDERLALVADIEVSLNDGAARLEELEANRRDLETLIERLGDALADIPADLGSRVHPAQQRGDLPMPVQGRVQAAFGQPRTAGFAWQGWLIEAQPGSEVRSVGYGRVAYADWLRGYGLLLIVDHGEGFMSLYGHNESLRADVGDWVQPGAPLSTVGQGPEGRPGLYFELRRDGKAVDPAGWVRR